MKVSLRWLADYIDLPTTDPAEIASAFASLGHEVEGVEEYSADWTGVIIAKVLTVDAHPDADKVRVCTVTTGGEPIQVICGAWNFGAGAVVAYAMPGAVLPGDFAIGVRKIRGVESSGMICSESELRLGDDHTGILVLAPGAPIGEDLAGFVELPDVVFDLTITPNRPDVMSMVGVARELGAYFGVPHRRPDSTLHTVPGEVSIGVSIEDPLGCRRFTVREITGVEAHQSPFWMKRRLRAAGVRPISNIVDVTNYVMLELGHPLHSFDADRVRGSRLVVRRATDGEKMTTLDGVERSLTGADLVICDQIGPTSLAGTMGGADSEVVETTTRVLMEAAAWDPATILHMSRRHGLRSEASARFERGVDPNLALEASARAVRLLAAIGGGEILDGFVDEIAQPATPRCISLWSSEVERILGPGFDGSTVRDLLVSIDLEVAGDDPLMVTVPTFRPDLTRPIDLIEEVARLKGFDWFPESVPTGKGGAWTGEQRTVRALRQALVGAGFDEALNLSFSNPSDLDAFGYPDAHPARDMVRVRNPLRDEESVLRTGLLPGLVRSLAYNFSHGSRDVALFELGKVFFSRPSSIDPQIPDQPDRLAFAIAGRFGSAEIGGDARPVDYYTASAVTRLIGRRLGVELGFDLVDEPGFHPVRAALARFGDTVAGTIGELHPAVSAEFGLFGRVAVGELDVALLIGAARPPRFGGPSVFPPTEFDLAFITPGSLKAVDLIEATVGATGGLTESCRVFDEYVGASLEAGKKSLALRYVLRADDRTLTGEELGEIRRAMVAAAALIGAELRGQV